MTGRIYALGGPNEEGVIVALTPGLYVPSGRDPWGSDLTQEDCVIRMLSRSQAQWSTPDR